MKNKRFIIVSLIIVCLAAITAFAADPGSEGDPIVTKSYIDEVVIPEIKTFVNEQISKIQGSSGTNSSFFLVDLNDGQRIEFDAGAEFILRSGKGTVVDSELGGISDTTDGIDLAGGESVPSNHLLIIPRNDGRGFTSIGDSIVMVKGSYSVY